MKYALAVMLVGCGGPSVRHATPAGPPPGEAPPTSNTEATARPQPDAPGTAPVAPENGPSASLGPAPLPIVLASNPSSSSPSQVSAATHTEKVGAPLLKRGTIEVSGSGIDVATVTRYLNKTTASFVLCYESSATSNPNISGTTTLTFKIDSEGKVFGADTTGGLDREVERCLVNAVNRITFPKKAGASASVSYPLTFSMK